MLRHQLTVLRRGPSAPNSAIIRALLQQHQDPSITGQGCAGFSPGSADREHQIVPDPGQTPSPLRPGVNFRYTQVSGGSNPSSLMSDLHQREAMLVLRTLEKL